MGTRHCVRILLFDNIQEKITVKVNEDDCMRSWIRYPVWQHTFVSPSAFSRRAVVSYWRKYVHEVLVNRLGGLSLARKSVVRLTDRPDMTLDVYRGRKTTMEQQQQRLYAFFAIFQRETTSVTFCLLLMAKKLF